MIPSFYTVVVDIGKKIAVHLVRHFFLPHELDGRNVRGVGKKLPLDPLKMEIIRQIIFEFFR